jgi:hypothetical protein
MNEKKISLSFKDEDGQTKKLTILDYEVKQKIFYFKTIASRRVGIPLNNVYKIEEVEYGN